jgi:hemerythrin
MSESAPLPSLFGRFTAGLRDHDHLRTTLGRLREMCAAIQRQDGSADRLQPQTLLGELRVDLARHFSAEEAEGYFGTIVEEAPSLRPQVEALKNEHTVMLEVVDILCELALDVSDSPRLTDLARRLLARLEQHERRETALIRGLLQPSAN